MKISTVHAASVTAVPITRTVVDDSVKNPHSAVIMPAAAIHGIAASAMSAAVVELWSVGHDHGDDERHRHDEDPDELGRSVR